MRNCTRDESSADAKPPQAAAVKSRGSERCGKAGTRFWQAWSREASASEPTVADRIAQEVARRYLEPILEPVFHADSYGYRPGKRARAPEHPANLEIETAALHASVEEAIFIAA